MDETPAPAPEQSATPSNRPPRSRARALWTSIVGTSAAKVVQIGVGVLALIITARLLGASGRGTLVAVTTWVGTFTIFGTLSIDRIVLHQGANHSDLDWVGEAAAVVRNLVVISTAVSVGIGFALYVGTSGSLFGGTAAGFLALGALLVPLTLWDSLAGALLIATGNLGVLNRARVIGAIIHLAAIGILVWGARLGIAGAIIAAVCGKTLTGAVILARLRQVSSDPWIANWTSALAFVKQGLQLHINTVGNYIRAKVDILMLTYFLAPAAVGIYQMGSRLVELLLVVPDAAAQSLWQEMGRSSPDAVWWAQKRLIFQMLGVLLLFSVVGYVLVPYVVPFLAGESFAESVDVFRVLLPILIGRSMGGIIAPQIVARGWFWQASALGLAVAAANVAMNYVLIPRYGVAGAIGATLLSYGVIPVIATLIWAGIIERRVRAAKPREMTAGDDAV